MGNILSEFARIEHVPGDVPSKRGALFGNDGANLVALKVDSEGKLIISFSTTGAYSVSNVTPDRVFDPTATNDAEVAMVLATLIQDLINKNILE